MIILGLGGLLGDAASVLLKDGKPQAAAEETKIARTVRPGSIPEASINECLRMAHVRKEQVNVVAVARPFTRGPESHLHLTLRNEFPNAEIAVFEHQRRSTYLSTWTDRDGMTQVRGQFDLISGMALV